jgi:hypothetical protein
MALRNLALSFLYGSSRTQRRMKGSVSVLTTQNDTRKIRGLRRKSSVPGPFTPQQKPTMRQLQNEIALAMFGVPNDGKQCVSCLSGKIKYPDFRDELSWKEFGISGLCQKCQDGVFEGEEE